VLLSGEEGRGKVGKGAGGVVNNTDSSTCGLEQEGRRTVMRAFSFSKLFPSMAGVIQSFLWQCPCLLIRIIIEDDGTWLSSSTTWLGEIHF
jgi:hypothetical protein